MKEEKVKCIVCGEIFDVHDPLFYGYIQNEPICYPCYEDLSLFLDMGFKPSECKEFAPRARRENGDES